MFCFVQDTEPASTRHDSLPTQAALQTQPTRSPFNLRPPARGQAAPKERQKPAPAPQIQL